VGLSHWRSDGGPRHCVGVVKRLGAPSNIGREPDTLTKQTHLKRPLEPASVCGSFKKRLGGVTSALKPSPMALAYWEAYASARAVETWCVIRAYGLFIFAPPVRYTHGPRRSG
jgi:hypothetical protein